MRSYALFAAVMGAAVLVGVAGAACGGSEATIAGGDGSVDATDESSSTDSAGGDAANSDGGDSVSDGGSNIDPDGGGDPDAGLPDGGACNAVDNTAPAVTSTCTSFAPPLRGGALVAGKYYLSAVTALASSAFCAGSFLPTGFKQTLEMLVDASGVGTVQGTGQLALGPTRHATDVLTPGAGDTSPLQSARTCPATLATSSVRYESATAAGKTTLVLRLPYGKSEALYRYDKQ